MNYKPIIKFIKILSITALICTVLLFAFLMGASATPADASGEFTQTVTGFLDGIFNISDKVDSKVSVQSITIVPKKYQSFYFINETVALKVSFLPKGVDKEPLTFTVDNPDVATVTDDGKITFLKDGLVEVSAKLNSDNKITSKYSFECVGENPFEVGLNITSSDGGNLTVPMGQNRALILNGGKTKSTILNYTSSDGEIAGVFQGVVYGRGVGETTILASLTVNDKTIETYIPVTVTEGTLPAVSEITLKDYAFTHKNVLDDYKKLIASGSRECFVYSDNPNVLRVKYNQIQADSIGTATLTFVYAYDETVYAVKTFSVNYKKPKALTVYGYDEVTPGTYNYVARHSPNVYENNVKWSIVSGNAQIDDNGVLVVKNLGKVVIRCQSNIDETLFVDKTVEVKLYTKAYGFVRKLMGHGGLSALFGFGVFYVLLLFSKRKGWCALSPAVTFIYACLSEFIQYFTEGRFCLWTDVLLDFIGSLVGILMAVVILLLVILIWRIVSKRGAEKLIRVIKETNYTNIFKKKFDIVDVTEEITAIDDSVKQ